MSAVHFHPLATLREWRRRAQSRRQLLDFSDLMLHDIGITRADAEFIASKPFWKE
ncbi:MAG TPA: DUF1127 domain-containing protein [Stellaceae bacterium]|nr:DUF1127 domain-containing protein [Stellaceae bacterium]